MDHPANFLDATTFNQLSPRPQWFDILSFLSKGCIGSALLGFLLLGALLSHRLKSKRKAVPDVAAGNALMAEIGNRTAAAPAEAMTPAQVIVNPLGLDYEATAERPTPPDQMLLSGAGPTPSTPPPAHPRSSSAPTRTTSPPPAPCRMPARNLAASLLAAADMHEDDRYRCSRISALKYSSNLLPPAMQYQVQDLGFGWIQNWPQEQQQAVPVCPSSATSSANSSDDDFAELETGKSYPRSSPLRVVSDCTISEPLFWRADAAPLHFGSSEDDEPKQEEGATNTVPTELPQVGNAMPPPNTPSVGIVQGDNGAAEGETPEQVVSSEPRQGLDSAEVQPAKQQLHALPEQCTAPRQPAQPRTRIFGQSAGSGAYVTPHMKLAAVAAATPVGFTSEKSLLTATAALQGSVAMTTPQPNQRPTIADVSSPLSIVKRSANKITSTPAPHGASTAAAIGVSGDASCERPALQAAAQKKLESPPSAGGGGGNIATPRYAAPTAASMARQARLSNGARSAGVRVNGDSSILPYSSLSPEISNYALHRRSVQLTGEGTPMTAARGGVEGDVGARRRIKQVPETPKSGAVWGYGRG